MCGSYAAGGDRSPSCSSDIQAMLDTFIAARQQCPADQATGEYAELTKAS